jgi:nucleoside-diphosphate-sugar epimerase
VLALSRRPPPARAGIEWAQDTLENFAAAPAGCARILSLGPLDAFAAWVARTQPQAARIVAIGSTARMHKRDSPDAGERDDAQRLEHAEQALFEYGRRHGTAVTVLRPSLLYGNGLDRSLTPLALRARRWRVLPWPRGAAGLRQPVHVEDVARAVLTCLPAEASHGRGFDLPGGETLPFDAMVARCLARQAEGAHLLRLPDAVFTLGLRLVGLGAETQGWLWRARRDQLADAGAAFEAFGFEPRPFQP